MTVRFGRAWMRGCLERQQVARIAKVLESRKEELERVLKQSFADLPTEEAPEAHALTGTKYRKFDTTTLEYPLKPTIEIVGSAMGSRGQSRARILRHLERHHIISIDADAGVLLVADELAARDPGLAQQARRPPSQG